MYRVEECSESLGKTRRRRDEVSGSRRDETLCAELARESVANPLERGRVSARGHQSGNIGVAYAVQRRFGFSRQPPAARTTNPVGDRLWKRPLANALCASETQKLAQRCRIGL